MSRTIIRTPADLKPIILAEIHRRGGRVVIGTSRKPGPDWDIYSIVAAALGVSAVDQQLTIGDRWPEILQSGRKAAARDAKRNAWDYTMLVAVQQLKDPKRAGTKRNSDDAYLHSPQVGIWELTNRGELEALRTAS